MTYAPRSDDGEGLGPLARAVRGVDRFWFTPTNPLGLHVIRLLTGTLLLAWLLGYAGSYSQLLGRSGWFDETAYNEALRLSAEDDAPIFWGRGLVARSELGLTVQYWSSVGVIGLFAAGIATRITAPLTWLVVVAFTSNPVMSYGGDALLLMLTLYLAAAYALLDLWGGGSPTTALLGSRSAAPQYWRSLAASGAASVWANVVLRLIQIHTAVVVVMSGLDKLQDAEWWAGDALWYPMHPPFEMTTEQIQAILDSQNEELLILYGLAAYATLFWQINFPWLAWLKPTRWIAVTGAVVGCLGCWFVYRAPIFGPAILIGTLSFVPSTRWQRLVTGWGSQEGDATRSFPRSQPLQASRTG